MVNLLAQITDIKASPFLAQGADAAGFTFFSTDGHGNWVGDSCNSSAQSDLGHEEANVWFNTQKVMPEDIIAVLGHSYGGNRAR